MQHSWGQVPGEEAARRLVQGGLIQRECQRCAHSQGHQERSCRVTQDKEKSTFYFGDLPPAFEGKSFRKRTEQEVEEEGRRHDAAQQLKQRSRKDEIERLHNQNISKIQEGTRSRQGFRF